MLILLSSGTQTDQSARLSSVKLRRPKVFDTRIRSQYLTTVDPTGLGLLLAG